MAKKTEETVEEQVVKENSEPVTVVETKKTAEKVEATKTVRNRGYQKVELDVNGETIIVYPGKSVTVPTWYSVPEGAGLTER